MGFKAVKIKAIECLKNGNVSHEARGNIDLKNLLLTGSVALEEVISVIGGAKGNNYSHSPHHLDATIDVHIIKTIQANQHWYIKWYFMEPNCIFISVHY